MNADPKQVKRVSRDTSDLAGRSVDAERWRTAQRWENSFWRESQLRLVRSSMRRPLWKWPIRRLAEFFRLRDYNDMPIGNDWNDWWADKFERYQHLPYHIGKMLELGCGPHTNTRLIIDGRRVDHAVCSDPLIREYLALPRSWLRWAIRRGIVFGDDHPAEDCPFASEVFDVVIMINVLDHTCDPEACVRNSFRVLAPGGLLVLGNDILTAPLTSESAVGHPHWFDDAWLDRIVASHYETVFKKTLDTTGGRHPGVLSGCWLFIGKKPGMNPQTSGNASLHA